jgi:hypothetical protein
MKKFLFKQLSLYNLKSSNTVYNLLCLLSNYPYYVEPNTRSINVMKNS